MAEDLARHGDAECATMIFDSYDNFLAQLDRDEVRKHLEALPPEASGQDAVFQEFQTISKRFEDGLERFFFDSAKLRSLTRMYGVF